MVAEGDIIAGTYRVNREIDSGGLATVFEASHVEADLDRRRYALKVLKDARRTPLTLKLFRREVQRMLTLDHPAIVRCHGVVRSDGGRLVLVMDFVEGLTLSRRILKSGPLTGDDLYRLVERVVPALAQCHDAGVLHRDLAPDNLMVPVGGLAHTIIIDFGISKSLNEDTETLIGANFMGKIQYAAPEQFGLYDGNIGPWTDIYSLGLILAFAARGKSLFKGHATVPSALAVRTTRPTLPGFREPLRSTLRAALSPDPRQRPTTITAFTDQLAALKGDRQRLIEAPSAGAGVSRRHQSRPATPVRQRPPDTAERSTRRQAARAPARDAMAPSASPATKAQPAPMTEAAKSKAAATSKPPPVARPTPPTAELAPAPITDPTVAVPQEAAVPQAALPAADPPTRRVRRLRPNRDVLGRLLFIVVMLALYIGWGLLVFTGLGSLSRMDDEAGSLLTLVEWAIFSILDLLLEEPTLSGSDVRLTLPAIAAGALCLYWLVATLKALIRGIAWTPQDARLKWLLPGYGVGALLALRFYPAGFTDYQGRVFFAHWLLFVAPFIILTVEALLLHLAIANLAPVSGALFGQAQTLIALVGEALVGLLCLEAMMLLSVRRSLFSLASRSVRWRGWYAPIDEAYDPTSPPVMPSAPHDRRWH